jgi:hypothetical protein
MLLNNSTLSPMKIAISRKISLAIATVVTILSGTILPSHADRSCPLGFTPGLAGCQKVVKVTIENVCATPKFRRLDLLVGRDLCRKKDNPLDVIDSVTDKSAKYEAAEKIKREIDPGFTNPGVPNKQRKVFTKSEKILIDHDSITKQDYTEITFDVIILPNFP